MAYIVPKEIPKSCHDCPFHYCSEYHPFWSADKEKRNTQTIRCQAIKPFRSTILDIKDETFKADWCPLVDSADVAPKTEVENLIKVIDNTTKQFLELHDLYQSAKREVERLQAELDDKQFRCDSCDRIMLTGAEHRACVKQAKTKVALDVIREIHGRSLRHFENGGIVSLEIDTHTWNAIVKKYTGDQT